MRRLLKLLFLFASVLACDYPPPAGAAPAENRLALVIGNAAYKSKTLATAVNDAALIAQTLQAAGFEVMGARDLDEDLLRKAFRDFIDHVTKAGPNAVALVYFAGYGLQFEGENYLVPIQADIAEASDVPRRALLLSEQTRALAALHLKATFVVLDAGRSNSIVLPGAQPAGGLAWVEPETNMLIAFNAAPGTVSPDDGTGYGPYAKALAEMIREGGLTPANMFDRVRLRVNDLTKGAQVPWDTSKIDTPFMFFERGPGAPPRADSPERTAWMRSQSMRSLGAHNAYMVALMRDTFDAYADFLADYWHDPMTKRVRVIIAARREAITWRRTCQANVPDAYWSYLERYPHGPHVADARRLLTHLGATIAPPAKFAVMAYDVPQPLPDELEYIERPVLVLDDPAFAFEPLQPSSAPFLEPPSFDFLALEPPTPSAGTHILPVPKFVSLPAYVHVPTDVIAPKNSFIVNNTQETPLINSASTKPAEHSAPLPNLPPTANDFQDGPSVTASVETKATLSGGQSAPPPLNPTLGEGIKVRQSPRAAETPSTPYWAVYDPAGRIKVPQISSAPMTSLVPFWAAYDPGVWEKIRGPQNPWGPRRLRRPLAFASPPTGMPLRPSRATMLSPPATGSVPSPIRRPVTVAPVSNESKRKLAPQLARAPDVGRRVSPPKPQPKPCPAANGICG